MVKWIKNNLLGWYDPLMDWKWNISNLWGRVTHPFTRTWHWFIKSIQYSRILWRDYDWDYGYILVLLKYKLQRTRKRITKDNLVLKTPLIANEILHVEKLIEKFMEHDFCAEEFEMHDKKWGKLEIDSTPVDDDTQSAKPKLYKAIFSRSNVKTVEDEEQEEKEFRALMDKQEREKQECWNEIFDTMKKYMQGWWD